MLAKSAWEVTSSHCLPRRGLDWRKPLLSDVMVSVHQPRKSEREKASNLFKLTQWRERILQGSWSGNEAQHAQISAQFAIFSLTDGFQKFKVMILSMLGQHIIAFSMREWSKVFVGQIQKNLCTIWQWSIHKAVRYTYLCTSRYTYPAYRQVEKADKLKRKMSSLAILKALSRKYYFQ